MKTTKATRDEFCEWCGYSFDAGDDRHTDDTESYVYCSRNCSRQHTAHYGLVLNSLPTPHWMPDPPAAIR